MNEVISYPSIRQDRLMELKEKLGNLSMATYKNDNSQSFISYAEKLETGNWIFAVNLARELEYNFIAIHESDKRLQNYITSIRNCLGRYYGTFHLLASTGGKYKIESPDDVSAVALELLSEDKENLTYVDYALLVTRDIVHISDRIDRVIYDFTKEKKSRSIDAIEYRLQSILRDESDFEIIINALSAKGYVDPISGIWIGKTSGKASFIIQTLIEIAHKGYLAITLTDKICRQVASNTFQITVSLSTAQKALAKSGNANESGKRYILHENIPHKKS